MKKNKLPTIATLGSHSALDICRGAKDLGFSTLVVAQTGRASTYNTYYQTQGQLGCVDSCLEVTKFSDLLTDKVQQQLVNHHAIFIPHRSLEVYLDFDYDAIANKFQVPLFGNKQLLRIEERSTHPNQYDVLQQAGIPYPRQFVDPQQIDRLCLVKVLEAQRGFERAFFLASSEQEYHTISRQMIKQGKITAVALSTAVIEEFVVGAQVNFNFFYSPLTQRLELMGTDTRRQTNLDGLLRLPAQHQATVLEQVAISYEEAGHQAVTVLESLLELAFKYGEAFVFASRQLFPPGIIGPFALQTIITAGPPRKDLVVIDVSPRMPGSPGISATPYSSYLYGRPMSVGQRVAQEILAAIQQQRLEEVTT